MNIENQILAAIKAYETSELEERLERIELAIKN